jgi:CRISPR-associated protein Cas1
MQLVINTPGSYLRKKEGNFLLKTEVYMFSQRKVKKEYFDEIKNGLTLNKEGKAALIQDLNETFEKGIRYRGRNIKNRDIIQFECHRIANGLIKGEENAGVGDI